MVVRPMAILQLMRTINTMCVTYIVHLAYVMRLMYMIHAMNIIVMYMRDQHQHQYQNLEHLD